MVKGIRQMCRTFMIVLTAAALLGGCAGGARSLPAAAAGPGTSQYRLDAGDEIRITAYGLDAINNAYTVSDAGDISLPLIDNVQARGKTVGELQSDIMRLLVERQILRSPSVNVQMTKYRPFYILGEVKSPGEYPYRPGMSVLTAIAMAGGYTFRADQKNMTITRQLQGRNVMGRARDTTTVQPGDTIRVSERWF
jgi:polysaccharide biosynthesis/export protein